jgi:hypothetical protein
MRIDLEEEAARARRDLRRDVSAVGSATTS